VVDADVLRRRLEALLSSLDRLERFRALPRDAFVEDPDVHHLAERHLHLAVEAALDIAHHLIAARRLETPESYRDAFAILARHGVLGADLAARLQAWAGFRNILVHGYLDVDHGLAWDAIRDDLHDLRALAAIAAALL
jgi:uncharacterized protein YutE (UPF0331/DUF86 family)